MATFDDFKRVIKETVQVDSKERFTPQEVKFINRKNEFYGKFIGEAKIYGLSADGSYLKDATIVDTKLSNVSLYASDGTVISLSDIADQLYFMGQDIGTLSSYCIELSNATDILSTSSSELSSLLKKLSVYTEDTVDKLSNDIDTISSYIDNLSSNYDLKDSNISIITKISQDKGLLSIEAKNLVSSDVEGLQDYVQNEIKLSVHNISGDANIEHGYTISKISQTDGKISIETRNIVSSDITGLSNFVKNEIELSVNSLDYLMDPIVSGKTVRKVVQNNGVISVELRDLLSNDVNGLPEYVADRISAAIGNITTEKHIEHGYVIHNFGQKDGKISADYIRLVSSDISGLPEYVASKDLETATNLSGNLTSFVSDHYLKKTDFDSTLSGSFTDGDLSFNKETQEIILNVKGKELKLDAKVFITSGIIDDVEIKEEASGKLYLHITFITEGSSRKYIDIDLAKVIDIHTAGHGISINLEAGKQVIAVDYTQISNEVSATVNEAIKNYHNTFDWRTLKLLGHIKLASDISVKHDIKEVFSSILDDHAYVFNGSVVEVAFTDAISAATIDGKVLVGPGDSIVIHDHELSTVEIPIDDLSVGKNVYIHKAGVSHYDHINLSSDLISTITDISTSLSSKIHDKVFIKTCDNTISNTELSNLYYGGDYSDLSIIRLPIDEYKTLVKRGSTDPRAFYIISADYVDNFGKEIKNLSTEGIDGTSDAANTGYVDKKKDELSAWLSSNLESTDTSLSVKKTLFVNSIQSIDNVIMKTHDNIGWQIKIDDSMGVPNLMFTKMSCDTDNNWSEVIE